MRDAFGRCEPRRRDQARKEKGKQTSQEGKVKSEHGGRRQDYLYKIWGTAVRTTCDKDPGAPVCPAPCLDQDHMRHSLVAPLTAVRDARSPRCPPRRPRQSSGVERVVRGVLVVFGIELSSADATASGDGRDPSQNNCIACCIALDQFRSASSPAAYRTSRAKHMLAHGDLAAI